MQSFKLFVGFFQTVLEDLKVTQGGDENIVSRRISHSKSLRKLQKWRELSSLLLIYIRDAEDTKSKG
jgi:hypothetical protein